MAATGHFVQKRSVRTRLNKRRSGAGGGFPKADVHSDYAERPELGPLLTSSFGCHKLTAVTCRPLDDLTAATCVRMLDVLLYRSACIDLGAVLILVES